MFFRVTTVGLGVEWTQGRTGPVGVVKVLSMSVTRKGPLS